MLTGPLGRSLASDQAASVAGAIGVGSAVIASCWLQWFLLRRSGVASIAWLLSGPSSVACFGVLRIIIPDFDLGLAVAFGGPVLAIFQWLALRRRVAQSAWWILTVIVAWYVGGFLSGAVSPSVGWWLIGALNGAVAGIVLRALLDLPASCSMRT